MGNNAVTVEYLGRRDIDIAAQDPWWFWSRPGEITTSEEMANPERAEEVVARLMRAREQLARAEIPADVAVRLPRRPS
jgi:hypothetical protein